MKTTVQLLCMTCPERLSADDEVGGEEATTLVDAMAEVAGWVRVERRPGYSSDVCTWCASLIAEAWSEVLNAEHRKMRAKAEAALSGPPMTEEEKAQLGLFLAECNAEPSSEVKETTK